MVTYDFANMLDKPVMDKVWSF